MRETLGAWYSLYMETWRDVPGRPGYMVSDQGRAAKIMQTKPGKNGYIQMSVPVEQGKPKRYKDYLHHWVLWAFKGQRPSNADLARHLNDIRTDNRAENLEWGTRSENQLDWRRAKHEYMTVCKRGHVLAEVGTYPGNRCRKCRIDRAARRRKEAAP